MTTILLARHGETPWNREERIQGWAATGLTDRGQRQATALGSWLIEPYDVDRVVASDLYRTRETTARVREAAASLPEPTFDADFRERSFGVYQGFLDEELFARYPDHESSVSALDIDPLDGESIDAFCDRVRGGWKHLCATADPDETVLVVTHGGVLKVLLSEVDDRDRDAMLARHSHHNCAVTEIAVENGTAELVAEEQTDWRELADELLDA